MHGRAIETFAFRPEGAILFRCEIDIVYDCPAGPQLYGGPDSARLLGCPQLGFVVSHGYRVGRFFIDRVEPIYQESPDCDDARRFRFLLKYRFGETVGLGFNLGVGTGTFGFGLGTKEREIWLESAVPICCDGCDASAAGSGNAPLMVSVSQPASVASVTGLVVGMVALALAYRWLDPVARDWFLIAIALIAVAIPLFRWSGNDKKAEGRAEEKPPEPPVKVPN
ncbi:hypothetical protein [Sphingosinithalassobacter portus]|uniref:hypothetical protein n=1 Tax=Stakelama portus TaxID=2676234 RepID=UPI000D6E0607|nr:hypothetical protein [Sphingosinithalassobacter portus]